MQKYFTLACLFCFTVALTAQDLSTPLLDGTWQSTFSNPALLSRLPGKITIGLPGVYNDLFVENITYNDLLVEANGRTFLDANQGISLLGDRNQLRNNFDLETIGVAIRGEKLAFGFAHRLRYNAEVEYPKTLAQVIWQGNAQFIGQTIDIAPLVNVLGYHEFGFSAAYTFAEKLTVSGRFKYLSGISDASTEEGSTLRLTTAEDTYDLTLDQDYVINSSNGLSYEGLDGVSTDFEFASLNFDNFIGKNTGIGFDFGAHLDLGKLRLQAAALDLGAGIDWQENVTNYTLSGQAAFTGLDVLQDLLDDTTSFSGLLDTLEMQFAPAETNNAYRSTIGSQFLLGGEFDVNDRLTVGALVHYTNRQFKGDPGVVLSGRFRVLDALMVGGTYSYRAESAANIGVNLTAQLGPVVLLLATDNVVTALRPKDSNRANVRLGLSLSFGEAASE